MIFMMKRTALTLVLLLALTGPAFAQEGIEVETLAPMEGEKTPEDAPVSVAPSAAEQEKAEKTLKEQAILICQSRAIMAGAGADIAGPDYVEGVDAYGEPVVPAEGMGEASAFSLPERVDIPIQVDVLGTLGIAPVDGLDMKGTVGTLTLLKDGSILYNEMDIGNDVRRYCNEHAEEVKEEVE